MDAYNASEPFHLYLQTYFKKNKQFGSKDRRFYKDCCYGYFRFKRAFETLSTEDTIIAALWLQNIQQEELKPILDSKSELKSQLDHFTSTDILSTYKQCGTEIPLTELTQWFLKPAPVFAIVNPGKETKAMNLLKQSQISFVKNETGYQFQQNTNLNSFIEKNLLRIMDKGSQLSVSNLPLKSGDKIWDCCSGAGGKSLFITQFYQDIILHCSDVRPSIVKNLTERFISSSLPQPVTSAINLELDNDCIEFNGNKISQPFFDVIICDVPCTGSGTWRRNPESYFYFNPDSVTEYSNRQKKIAENAWKYLKPGGLMLYITCSVFPEENENNAQRIAAELGGTIKESSMIGGPEYEADYLFRAVIQKKK